VVEIALLLTLLLLLSAGHVGAVEWQSARG